MSNDRSAALRNLVELRTPVRVAISEVSRLPWDSHIELVLVRTADLARALDEFARGALSERELVDWAESIYGRDDVGFDADHMQLLNDALYELSTPELFGPIAEIVAGIRTRLGR